MVQLQNQRNRIAWPSLIGRCVVSCTMVLLTQFAPSLVPRFLPASPLLIQLSISVVPMLVVVGLGGLYGRLLGIHASAPSFVVFTVLFIWCLYLLIIRKGVSLVMDFVFNGVAVLLITGLYSMLKSNPGVVEPSSSDKLVESSVSELCDHDEDSVSGRRVRYCKICKVYIKGFDHHCLAFGNCIDAVKSEISSILSAETSLSENLVVRTRIFSFLQLVWQVTFFTWHLYCICFNTKTDEWVNWKKYPEFHLTDQHQPRQSSTEIRFTNPYDKGILQNVKEFMSLKER